MFTSQIVFRTQSRVTFQAKSTSPINETEAKKAQDGHGYCADGYGFDGFYVRKDSEGDQVIYTANWGCAGSCD